MHKSRQLLVGKSKKKFCYIYVSAYMTYVFTWRAYLFKDMFFSFFLISHNCTWNVHLFTLCFTACSVAVTMYAERLLFVISEKEKFLIHITFKEGIIMDHSILSQYINKKIYFSIFIPCSWVPFLTYFFN